MNANPLQSDDPLADIRRQYGLNSGSAPRASVSASPRPAAPLFDAEAKLREYSTRYGADPDLAVKVMKQESGGQHYKGGQVLTSPKGARGYMQLLPDTAKSLGEDADDEEGNIRAGAKYLAQISKRFNNDPALTLAGYHSGPDEAEAALRNPKGNPKTHNYVRAILGADGYNAALSRFKGPYISPDDPLAKLRAQYEQPAPAASSDSLAAIRAQYADGAQAQGGESTDTHLLSPGVKADWGDQPGEGFRGAANYWPALGMFSRSAPATKQNVGAMIDELRENKHVQTGAVRSPQTAGDGRLTPVVPATPITGNPRSVINEQMNVSAGKPYNEDDLYREWYNARAAGDFDTATGLAEAYLKDYPEGKYRRAVRGNTPKLQTVNREAPAHGAGAYFPVEQITAMRSKGIKDDVMLKHIQDTVAGQMGLSQAETDALTQQYGEHPIQVVEPGSDSRSSVDSIIKQGKSAGGLAEFAISPDVVAAIEGAKGRNLRPTEAAARAAGQGLHDIPEQYFNTEAKRRADPEGWIKQLGEMDRQQAAGMLFEIARSRPVTDAELAAAGMERNQWLNFVSGAGGVVGLMVAYLGHAFGSEKMEQLGMDSAHTSQSLGNVYGGPGVEEGQTFKTLGRALTGDGDALRRIRNLVVNGAGSMLAFATAPGGAPGAGAIGTLSSIGSVYTEAIDAGVDPDTAFRVSILAAPAGALEAFGVNSGSISREIRKKVMGSFIKGVLKAAGKGALKESAQEGVQQILTNMVRKGLIDENINLMEGVGPSMLAGVILGGLGEGSGHVIGHTMERVGEYKEAQRQQRAEEMPARMLADAVVANQSTDMRPRLVRNGEQIAVAPGERVRVSPDAVEDVQGEADQSGPIVSAPVQTADRGFTTGPDEVTPVPESRATIREQMRATIREQMRALRDGDRYAVVITPGTDMPRVPRGYVATETEKGTFIHDPALVSAEEVQIMVDDGTYGQLLGHVEPKSERTTQAVVARNPQTGVEQQASYVSPERVDEQAAELKRQFPNAEIEAGGADVEQRLLDDRASALQADQAAPSVEASKHHSNYQPRSDGGQFVEGKPVLPEAERVRVAPHEVEDIAPVEMGPEVESHLTQHGLPVEEVKQSLGVDRSDAPDWVKKSDAYIKDLASGKIQSANPVEGFLHVARVTAWDVFKATQDKAAWSRKMTLRLKDRVKPHLDALWDFITAGKFGPEAVMNRLKESRLVPNEIILGILSGERPEYVDRLIDHLAEQKQKVVNGAITTSDLARSYFITGASQRSDAIKLSTLQAKLQAAGINIPGLEQYAEAGRTGEMKVRPEDAAGAWLMTETGQKALADLEDGRFNEKAWREGAKVRAAFGDDRIAKLAILSSPRPGAFNMRNIGQLLDEMNAAKGDGNKIAQSITKLNGVGIGKNPFMAHLLGFGARPTVDAVEINAWLTGRGSLRGQSSREAELARAVKDFTGNQELVQALSDRINRRINDLRKSGAIGSDIPAADYGAVIHHWLWNEMKGSRHSHPAMYEAMRQEPPFIAEARARLKASLTGSQMNMNPAQGMVDEASVIGWQAYRKAKDFASWSTHMTATLGERIKPLLSGLWSWFRGFRSSSNSQKTGTIETASSAIKSGLLTSARVIINNPVSNATFQVMEEVARNPAALADMVWSGARKMVGAAPRRTITGTNLTAIAHGAREGATRGVREAGEILQRGATSEEMESVLQTQEVRTGIPPLDALINVPFRVQSAQDRVFRVAAYQRALEGIAEVVGKNQGLKGNELKARTAELVTEAMAGETMRARAMNLQAASEAEIAVFANSNPVSDMFAGAKEGLKKHGAAGEAIQFGIDRVVPFPRSGTNVAMRALDYTGVSAPFRATAVLSRTLRSAVDMGLMSDLKEGDIRRATQTLIESVSRADQRKVSEMIGRGLTGQAIMFLGAKLGILGLLTGFFASSPADRGLDEAEGKRPGALKVGNQWVELKGAGVLSNLLVLGASLADIANNPEYDRYGKQKGNAARRLKTAGDFALDQPIGRPIKDAWEAAQAPEAKAQRMVGNVAGQVVPGWMADIAAMLDDVERDTKPEGKDFLGRTADSMKKGVMRRIPGLREQLPEKLDALGRPVERGMYSNTSRAGDPVIDEMRRLDIGIAKGKHGAQVQERLSSVIGSEAYSRDPGGKFSLVDVQAAALLEAIKVARDDEAAGREVRRSDASAIMFNAKVTLERDAVLDDAKDSEFWKLSRDQRRRFEQSIKRDYAAARASLAPGKTVADEIADGREKLSELRSSKGDIIRRAKMRAKGVPVE